MTRTLDFQIVSPGAVEYHDAIDAAILKTEVGEITILPDHAPLVSLLRPGRILIRKGIEETVFILTRGVLEVLPGSHATILGELKTKASTSVS